MLKISLGTKPSFFFCGSIAMSRKTNSYLSLDVSKLTDKEVQGLLRAQKTGAIVINEGLELLENYKKEPTEDVKQETTLKEETQHGQETNEEGQQEVAKEVLTDAAEDKPVQEEDKSEEQPETPVKQTRNTRKKS